MFATRARGVGRPSTWAPVLAEEVADVGHDPRRAGLDEPVLAELVDVGVDDVELAGEHLESVAHGAARALVGGAERRREEGVQRVDGQAAHTSSAMSAAASVTSCSGAAGTSSPPLEHGAQHARHRLQDRQHLADATAPTELARVERERRRERRNPRGEHVGGDQPRVDLAARPHGGRARDVVDDLDRLVGVAGEVDRRARLVASASAAVQRRAGRRGDGEEHDPALAVPDRVRARLRDPRERAREVLVVAQRDDAAHRQDRQRRVAARLVEQLRVGAAARGHRVGDAAQSRAGGSAAP